MVAGVLVAVALSGCIGPSPRSPHALGPSPATDAPIPPGVEAVLEAYQTGGALPLQSLARHAELFRGLPALPAQAPEATALADALLPLLELDGVLVTPAILNGIAGLGALPRDVQDALAVLALATVQSATMTREAFAGVALPVTPETADRVDWGLALQALRVKLAAVDATMPVLRSHAGGVWGDAPPLDVCGSVAIAPASESQRYTCNYTLLVDFGGDDVYLGNAGGTFSIYGSPLHLDLAGNDQYLSTAPDHTGVTGGSVGGVGTLVDASGDDTYNTTALEGTGHNGGVQGGVGFLADLGGKDLVMATGMLHSGVNGGAWIGHGFLLLEGGDDVVDGWTEGAGALNGAGFLGTGLLVGLGGNRLYKAVDSGQPIGGMGNGGGNGGGQGTLLDHGGDTRYEAQMGSSPSAANGGGGGGFGSLLDLGGGDDTYIARAGPGSSVNGDGINGGGLLFDDGGKDTYDDGATVATDASQVPKGNGAQVDAKGAKTAPRDVAALQPWPAVAQPVARGLLQAADNDYSLASLHALSWSAAGLPGDAPREPLPAATSLPTLLAGFLSAHGEAGSPAALADLATLPLDLQQALARLLAAYIAAEDLVRAAPAPTEDEPGSAGLRARGLLFDALEAARPTLTKYAGLRLADATLDVCGLLNIDLTGASSLFVCNYAFQVTLGGDSVYRNNAGGSLPMKAGFLVDAAGNDRYEGDVTGVQYGVAGGASGVFGLGFLADLAGDDHYMPHCEAGCSALGGAQGGTGALLEFGGDDHYAVEAGAIAAATGGASGLGRGFLADFGGSDTYMVRGPHHTASNGGAIFANGFLFDREGDDTYHAKAGEHGPLNGGAIIGSGMLLDLAGNDVYFAESGHHAMVNGAAFWGTPGAFLLDGAGNDRYVAVSGMKPFANGRGWFPGECPGVRNVCTRGVSMLLDQGGWDEYLEWETGMGGHGHGQASREPAPAMAQDCAEPEGHDAHAHEHACEPKQECATPEGHDAHTHEHACMAEEDCAEPQGHEAHTHEHACGGMTSPPPAIDQTEAPKGDAGAQLDLKGSGFAETFRAWAGN